MTPNKGDQDVAQCVCGKHCRINCPHFCMGLEDCGVIQGCCALYKTLLVFDLEQLNYCKVIFCRNRRCRKENYVYTERETCQAPN